jgi:hypothetical protein
LPPYTVEDVKRAYLDRAVSAHPDRGGSSEQFIKLHNAYLEATKYAGIRASRMHWLGAWVEQYAAQQQVIDEVKRLGGEVEVDAAAAVAQSIGGDFANVLERLVGIRFHGPQVGDRVVHYLVAQHATLAGLNSLALVECRLSDAAVARLAVLSNLRRLDLRGTPVSYRGLQPLLNLRELEWLGLAGTRVGWWRRLKIARQLRRRTRDREKSTPRMP